MGTVREEVRIGKDYLDAITTLLQRVRNAHPTDGLYEAAELQWWWRIERSTDSVPQLFWFDESGLPMASVTATDFGNGRSALYSDVTMAVSHMPDADAEWVTEIVERGLAHFASVGITALQLEVNHNDEVVSRILEENGFVVTDENALVECWLDEGDRPEVSALAEGYRLLSRAEASHLPHHMTLRNGPNVEERLQQTSMYRNDLDLVVLDRDDRPAAYGMFWYDPQTHVGVVEPMRTHDEHQKKGLARHILTAGVDALAHAGASRISIGWEPDNPASGHLYQSVGFVPHRHTEMWAGPTAK